MEKGLLIFYNNSSSSKFKSVIYSDWRDRWAAALMELRDEFACLRKEREIRREKERMDKNQEMPSVFFSDSEMVP
jgi:hypothetical protein